LIGISVGVGVLNRKHFRKRKVPVFTDSGANSPFSRTPGGKNSSRPQVN